MEHNNAYIAIAVLLMTVATMITRFLPFALFRRREAPGWLVRGTRLIPGAVMLVLVYSSLPFGPGLQSPEFWIPWVAVGVTAGLHLGFGNTLLSIFGGTGLYMLLNYLY